jgi:Arc/MetJ-type ribon-helix-helix transcriptional regulator
VQSRETPRTTDPFDVLGAGFSELRPCPCRPAGDARALGAAHLPAARIRSVDGVPDEPRDRAAGRPAPAAEPPRRIASTEWRSPGLEYAATDEGACPFFGRHGPGNGMVSGMATTKVTITLEDDQLDEVRRLVAAGKASSVSGFVKHAVGIALHDAAGWQEMLESALEQTGGPLTNKERVWADALLSRRPRKRRSRRKTAA